MVDGRRLDCHRIHGGGVGCRDIAVTHSMDYSKDPATSTWHLDQESPSEGIQRTGRLDSRDLSNLASHCHESFDGDSGGHFS